MATDGGNAGRMPHEMPDDRQVSIERVRDLLKRTERFDRTSQTLYRDPQWQPLVVDVWDWFAENAADVLAALAVTAPAVEEAPLRDTVDSVLLLVERVRVRIALFKAPSELRLLGEAATRLWGLRASLAERERATEAALAEAREARWGAEYALADTREALRDVLEWPLPQGTVETYSLPPWLAAKARAVLAAVPPQQGAPADTDARPANNAGTRGGESL
jgi:hypothetical protein